jgi:hypothetical protein
VFGVSASQYGGPGPGQMYAIGPPPLPPPMPRRRSPINYFILPVFIIQCIGIACLVCLWGYLRYVFDLLFGQFLPLKKLNLPADFLICSHIANVNFGATTQS